MLLVWYFKVRNSHTVNLRSENMVQLLCPLIAASYLKIESVIFLTWVEPHDILRSRIVGYTFWKSSWSKLAFTDGFRIEVVEFINRLRRLHGAGPLIISTRISTAAQNWAQVLVSKGTASVDPNTNYGTNVFTKVGSQTGLAQLAVMTWYTSVKYYDWARRQPKILALPFIHLVWLSSNFVGVGLARSPSAKFYIVVYFDPMPGNKQPLLKENVLPYTGMRHRKK